MFSGFNEETNEYLIGIRFNNNKEWFGEHREMYRQNVHEPIKALADEVFLKMSEMDSHFMEIPKISRPNRDIRFSKNKSPYKECKWFFLRGDGRPDITYPRPTYFFEMSPDWWRYGFFFAPPPSGMQAYRKRIEADPLGLKKVIDIYNSQDIFEFSGENYKRLFNKDIEEPILDWYQKKYIQFISMHDYSEEVFYRPELSELVFDGFKTLYPIYKYFEDLNL